MTVDTGHPNVVAPSMYLPLIATALAAIAMPNKISTTRMVDIRMPIVFVLLAVASSDWREINRGWFLPVALVLSSLFVLRMAHITGQWHETDRHHQRFTRTLDQLPEGARLLSAIKLDSFDSWPPAEIQRPALLPMVNLSCWGIIRRSLLKVEEFFFRQAPIPWDQISAQYDDIVVKGMQRLQPPLPAEFIPFESEDEFQFYRISRQRTAQTNGTPDTGSEVLRRHARHRSNVTA